MYIVCTCGYTWHRDYIDGSSYSTLKHFNLAGHELLGIYTFQKDIPVIHHEKVNIEEYVKNIKIEVEI